jgi:hypothetical protein
VKKVIFLDIDGVLNSSTRWKESHEVDPRNKSAKLDPIAVWRLKQIIGATGAKIVISSTWRNIFPLDWLTGTLWKYGIPKDTIIGKTPKVGRRGHEINHWLKKNPVDRYLIIDDDSDAWAAVDHKLNNFIHTTFEEGLQHSHILDAVKILGKKEEAVH